MIQRRQIKSTSRKVQAINHGHCIQRSIGVVHSSGRICSVIPQAPATEMRAWLLLDAPDAHHRYQLVLREVKFTDTLVDLACDVLGELFAADGVVRLLLQVGRQDPLDEATDQELAELPLGAVHPVRRLEGC